MRKLATVLLVLMVVASASALAGEERYRISGKKNPVRIAETPPDQQHGKPLVRLAVDPVSGEITFLPSLISNRGAIDASFSQVSAVCLDCGSCPLVTRNVQVTLRALGPVAAGYLVGQLTTGNANLTRVQVNRKDALVLNDLYIVDVRVDVIDCGQSFQIWFDVCQPGDPNGVVTNPCP